MIATSSLPDWLTAFGTVGAVVIAVLTPVGRKVLVWMRRPVISISLGEEEPYVQWNLGAGGISDGLARIEVNNAGKAEAKNVRVQIVTIWDCSLGESIWYEQRMVPTGIPWAGSADRTANIIAQASAFVEICSWITNSTLRIGSGGRLFEYPLVPSKTYKVGVAIVGDNVAGSEFVVQFSASSESVHAFVISEKPSEVQRGGLAAQSREIFDQLQQLPDE